MAETILVLNAGSSSIKFQLFAVGEEDRLVRRLKGQIDGIGTSPKLRAKGKDGEVLIDSGWPAHAVADVPAALDRTVAWLQQQLGDDFLGSATAWRVAARLLRTDRSMTPFSTASRASCPAPLHQPNNLAPIRAVRTRRPDMPQVACFDTAFHHRHSEIALRYAIPDELHREGVRRYGFHGLSYEFIAASLPRVAPAIAGGRVVVAHLGSGASMCAFHAGRSIDSTMGFTALDGLPMGTRTGQIDPGVLLYLLATKGWDVARLERFLYQECGLKGLSGVSNDMRDLLASEAPLARIAVDYFVYRIQREAAALAAAMGGIDGLVFTGGIG
jgi:acetate kinase